MQGLIGVVGKYIAICNILNVFNSAYRKYMWCALGGDELMFDLKADPMEQHNLAGEKEAGEALAHMRRMLIQHLKKYNSPQNEHFYTIKEE